MNQFPPKLHYTLSYDLNRVKRLLKEGHKDLAKELIESFPEPLYRAKLISRLNRFEQSELETFVEYEDT